jgi:hypothetical protein
MDGHIWPIPDQCFRRMLFMDIVMGLRKLWMNPSWTSISTFKPVHLDEPICWLQSLHLNLRTLMNPSFDASLTQSVHSKLTRLLTPITAFKLVHLDESILWPGFDPVSAFKTDMSVDSYHCI